MTSGTDGRQRRRRQRESSPTAWCARGYDETACPPGSGPDNRGRRRAHASRRRRTRSANTLQRNNVFSKVLLPEAVQLCRTSSENKLELQSNNFILKIFI